MTNINESVKGLLKLEHCFTPPKNEDAEIIEVQAGDKKLKIVMAPGWNLEFSQWAREEAKRYF